MMISSRSAAIGAALATALLPALAHAVPATLVSGQTLTLALSDEAEGPVMQFQISKANLKGSLYQAVAVVRGETRAERRARGDQVALDNIEGQNLVAFTRYAADDLRGRYAERRKPVTASVAFDEFLAVETGALMKDSLKAGFTFGLAMPTTTPITFNSHMEFTIDDGSGARVVTCDAKANGRPPRIPKVNDPHAHDELDRMQDVGRKACYALIQAQLNGATTEAANPVAAATP